MTLGTTAPWGSVTVPEMTPVMAAYAGMAIARTIVKEINLNVKEVSLFFPREIDCF